MGDWRLPTSNAAHFKTGGLRAAAKRLENARPVPFVQDPITNVCNLQKGLPVSVQWAQLKSPSEMETMCNAVLQTIKDTQPWAHDGELARYTRKVVYKVLVPGDGSVCSEPIPGATRAQDTPGAVQRMFSTLLQAIAETQECVGSEELLMEHGGVVHDFTVLLMGTHSTEHADDPQPEAPSADDAPADEYDDGPHDGPGEAVYIIG